MKIKEGCEVVEKDKVFYKGLQVRTLPGVHEEVIKVVLNFIDRKAQVLEVGSGAGSFTQRLLDNRIQVTASGIDPDDFQCHGTEFQYLDIQDAIPDELNSRFQMVIATEVIEHLENDFLFFRNVQQLLKPGGILVLSTPNVLSAYSRFMFLKSGRVLLCNENLMDEWGHIQILPQWLLQKMGENAGFESLESKGVGTLRFENLPFWHKWFQNMVVPAAKILVGESFPDQLRGSNLLMVFKRPEK